MSTCVMVNMPRSGFESQWWPQAKRLQYHINCFSNGYVQFEMTYQDEFFYCRSQKRGSEGLQENQWSTTSNGVRCSLMFSSKENSDVCDSVGSYFRGRFRYNTNCRSRKCYNDVQFQLKHCCQSFYFSFPVNADFGGWSLQTGTFGTRVYS